MSRSHPHYAENGVFALKTHQMFSVQTTPPEKIEDATNTKYFGFVLKETLARKSPREL